MCLYSYILTYINVHVKSCIIELKFYIVLFKPILSLYRHTYRNVYVSLYGRLYETLNMHIFSGISIEFVIQQSVFLEFK